MEKMKVNLEELRQIEHNERMKVAWDRTKKKQKVATKKAKEYAELLSGPTEHIDNLRKSKVPIPQTLIASEMDATTPSKTLDFIEKNERLMQARASGYVHGLYLRIGVLALLWLVYVI